MLLSRYESFFFNANFKEACSSDGWGAYRGELVLREGEVTDAQGRRKPPQEVLKQAVVLACGDELKLLSGSLDELQYFSALSEKYAADFKPGVVVILYTVNIDKAFIATINGAAVVFIPLVQGMVWNELCEIVALEKNDFKGQSAADKVQTLYNALKAETFKYPETSIESALLQTNGAKRETHGAV